MEGKINEGNQEDNQERYLDSEERGEREEGEEQEFSDQDLLEENAENAEDEKYLDDEEGSDFGGMDESPLGGIYGLFKELVNKKDSKKVSNLTNEELGDCEFNVRDCESIALLSKTFNHPGVAGYFINRSRIITDTAMSRKGWFTELTVTSKKFASRDSSSSIPNLPQFQKKNTWKLFSKKSNQQEKNHF